MIKTPGKTLKPNSVEMNCWGRWGVGRGSVEVVTEAFGTLPVKRIFLNHSDLSKGFPPTRYSFLCCLGIAMWEGQVMSERWWNRSLLPLGSCLVSLLFYLRQPYPDAEKIQCLPSKILHSFLFYCGRARFFF